MFNYENSATKAGLDDAINALLSEMNNFSGDDEEYAKMVTQLDKLYKLKEIDIKDRDFVLKIQEAQIKEKETSLKERELDHKEKELDNDIELQKRKSFESWATIGVNLLGILLIVEHERTSVITSKALGLIFRSAR